MKNKMIKLTGVAVAVLGIASAAYANTITGAVGFSGNNFILDGSTVAASTEVLSWGTQTASGFINNGTTTTYSGASVGGLPAPFVYATGGPGGPLTTLPISGFWTIGIYSFQLTSFNYTLGNGNTSLNINMFGIVTDGLGDSGNWSGQLSTQNPNIGSSNSGYQYTGSLSFGSVPDGGTTILLLGSALSGLALLKRKLVS
jgi:hypothetical protein